MSEVLSGILKEFLKIFIPGMLVVGIFTGCIAYFEVCKLKNQFDELKSQVMETEIGDGK